ncbi:MAG: cyanophycinase [Planctomycetota bacterium]
MNSLYLKNRLHGVVASGLLRGSLAVMMVLAGAGFTWAQESGRLVIVGGRLSPEHERIYTTFLRDVEPNQKVGVVPLASGVPEESGPLTVQDIRQYAAHPDDVFNTGLVYTQPERALEPETARLLAGCRALWFTGGDQSRITAALRPVEGDTPVYGSVEQVLKQGGTIGGTSAGAAMMSDPMIRSGNSADALLLGATDILDGPGVCVGQGMGFFDHGLVDQHFLRRGRFGRLLVALEATETAVGFGVSENRGMELDRATGVITTLGEQAITVIDRRQARTQERHRENIRVSLLGGGDRIDTATYAVTTAPEKIPLSESARDLGLSVRFPDMWDRHIVAEMIKVLAAQPDQPVLAQDRSFDYRMTADDQTRFYLGESGESLTAVNVRLDITPGPNVEEDAQSRREELAETGRD